MWGGALGNHQGGATHFTTLWLCVGGGFGDGTVPLPGFWRFARQLPHFQSLHPFPVCNWHPPSCCSSAESQSGFVNVLRLCRPFKHSLLKIQQFLSLPQPLLVFTTRIYGDLPYLLVLELWAVLCGLGLGSLAPKVSLLIFIHHMWMWNHLYCCCLSVPCSIFSPLCPARHLCPSHPFRWMWLLYILAVRFSDSSGCYLFWGLIVILSVVAWGGEACLPTPPSWLEVPILRRYLSYYFIEPVFSQKNVNIIWPNNYQNFSTFSKRQLDQRFPIFFISWDT